MITSVIPTAMIPIAAYWLSMLRKFAGDMNPGKTYCAKMISAKSTQIIPYLTAMVPTWDKTLGLLPETVAELYIAPLLVNFRDFASAIF
jgi:hypothetical protein